MLVCFVVQLRSSMCLILISSHATNFSLLPLLVELLFGLIFESTDILHRQAVPFVCPTEHLSVEGREESTLRLLYETLYATLKTEPLKFTCHKLIACHNRRHWFLPVRTDQGPSSGFHRFESTMRSAWRAIRLRNHQKTPNMTWFTLSRQRTRRSNEKNTRSCEKIHIFNVPSLNTYDCVMMSQINTQSRLPFVDAKNMKVTLTRRKKWKNVWNLNSLGGIFRFFVVGRWDRIVGNVNWNNFTLFQLLSAQLVDLEMVNYDKREKREFAVKMIFNQISPIWHAKKSRKKGIVAGCEGDFSVSWDSFLDVITKITRANIKCKNENFKN